MSKRVDVDALLKKHSKFLARLAYRFSGRIGFEEFYQAGALGLIEAAEKYDPDKGVRFLSFASRYIYYRMIEVLRVLYYPVRIPMYRNKVLNLIRKYGGLSEQQRKELGLSEAEANFFLVFADPPSIFSLDSGTCMNRTSYSRDGAKNLFEKTLASQISDHVWNSERYSDKEKLVLFLFYGLGGCDQMTLIDIYKKYPDVFASVSQVRRVFKHANKKFRSWISEIEQK